MPKSLICGIDEVGRGAIAGPLLAIASLFSVDNTHLHQLHTSYSPIEGVNDSKKFHNHKAREVVFNKILKSDLLVDFGIGEISENEIDIIGIDSANAAAFKKALEDLKIIPDYVLVDGLNPVQEWPVLKQECRPKADSTYWPVGAASILAKIIRDNLMAELGQEYPSFEWGKNAGYGTKDHMKAIQKVGCSPYHRRSFLRKYNEL